MTDIERRGSARDQPLSVVVPVRNFGHGMQQFLDMWRKPIEEVTHKSAEIIVADDASTDATPSIVEAYSTKHPEVTLIRHNESRGLGAALQTAIAASKHAIILVLWPDWSYQPSDLAAMVESFSGVDAVAPVRQGSERPKWLHSSGAAFRFLARWVLGIDFGAPAVWYGWSNFFRRLRYRTLFGLRLQDPTCGMRLVRRAVLEKCPIQSQGEFALVEMYAKANFVGALFHEVQLKRAGSVPVLREVSEMKIGDQKQVFRSPTFGTVN